ncbi:NAD(P)/FAD-dependent oxidoreductase [Billgrantia bachuensis]|uniref:NAD(P)/FAD-dependent oxidoreductase n=1 Tax=Billgrantia bachuensis TaxID=2717286 RepID=A0ABX0PV20_9GAMM|nr:NAD(P)/FAD-dependent oxidoreductase [Halomonas bachuensis]NIC07297.1 NAD(P)/FAD-dependent oxidoreductase [Halomonas bachuensis]
MEEKVIDCVVVGAGPAGLAAGINLQRFLRDIRIIDEERSRAELIPRTFNYPGFGEGISGNALLERLRAQLKVNGGHVTPGRVVRLERTADGMFDVTTETEVIRSRTVLLASGVVDIEPELKGFQEVKEKGLIRYCPICDGFEFTKERIGIIARDAHGVDEAVFIKRFSADLTLIDFEGGAYLDVASTERLEREKIALMQGEVGDMYADASQGIQLRMSDGSEYSFDALYCALGTQVRSDLGTNLGALRNPHGYLVVNPHMQTGIEGLYAAGDMTNHLSQITVATGQASIAATAIHNRLQNRR